MHNVDQSLSANPSALAILKKMSMLLSIASYVRFECHVTQEYDRMNLQTPRKEDEPGPFAKTETSRRKAVRTLGL